VRSLAALLLAFVAWAHAAQSDADLDARTQALASELRCVVCQNQTLADSNADLAADLRRRIREQLRNGASEDDVKAWLVQRYGDFVLYRPPVRPLTWLLWFGPALALVVVAAMLVRRLRRAPPPAPLDEAARERLVQLVAHDGEREARP